MKALFFALFSLGVPAGLSPQEVSVSWIWPDSVYDNITSILEKDGVIFAGTAFHNLWVSPDLGKTWVNRGRADGLIADFGTIKALTQTKGGDILAGTPNGLFRSSDNGARWRHIAAAFHDTLVHSICVTHSGTIFVGGAGVKRSTDNSETWEWVLDGDTAVPVPNYATSIIETATGAILAGANNATPNSAPGIFRSTDSGKTWTLAGNAEGLGDRNIVSMAAYPYGSGDSTVFAMSDMGGAFVSSDDGRTWQRITAISRLRGVGSIVAGPPIGIVLGFAGGGTSDLIFRSKDGGENWAPLHPDLFGWMGLSFARYPGNKLLIGTDAGLWLASFDEVTSVGGDDYSITQLPDYRLGQNYPNPFNPSTTIEFSVPERSFVKLVIYNLLGEEIETLVAEERSAGIYRIQWNAGRHPSGVYFYRLETKNFALNRKMIFLK